MSLQVPLLSICVLTFNGCGLLKQGLQAITQQMALLAHSVSTRAQTQHFLRQFHAIGAEPLITLALSPDFTLATQA
jgi:hypothetical protein